jgi:hypothetical protein
LGISLGAISSADELYMTNGSKLVGALVSAEDDLVTFDTPFAGSIAVNLANVERIVTEEAVIIMLEDGTLYRDRRIDASQTDLVATAAGQEPVTFTADDIQMINPEPWKLGEGYNWRKDQGQVENTFQVRPLFQRQPH